MANISKPLNQGFAAPNIIANYGPYSSVPAAHTALSEDGLNVVGMTVGIKIGDTITEYWYKGGTTQSHLVQKHVSNDELNALDSKFTTAIDNLENITSFLEGVDENKKLKPILDDITSLITEKANKNDVYLKSETYTKDEVDAAIEAIDVSEQLANYALKTEVTSAVANETTRAQGIEATKADKVTTYTKTETDTLLDTKQDNINDLITIRNGAALGATAQQPATTLAGYGITDAYTKTEVNELVSTPHQNYVTVATKAELDAIVSASEDTIYRVSSYDFTANNGVGAVDVSKYSEYAYNGSIMVPLTVKSQVNEVFDISEYKSATYADLATALGTDGENIPADIRHGGMSIKFVQSSDSKYVQYRLMTNTWSTTISDWQGVDEDLIDYRSNNLAKSSVVVEALIGIESQVSENQYFTPQTHFDDSESDLSISDENNNVLVKFLEGHIKTKNFDSRHLCTIEGNTLIIN